MLQRGGGGWGELCKRRSVHLEIDIGIFSYQLLNTRMRNSYFSVDPNLQQLMEDDFLPSVHLFQVLQESFWLQCMYLDFKHTFKS